LESYCEEVGLPKQWGNPSQTIPIPCEVSITTSSLQAMWKSTNPLN
jgi:hypothetical protein